MKLFYSTYSEENLLYMKWVGEWCTEDFLNSHNYIKQIITENRIDKLITDFRDASIDHIISDFSKFKNLSVSKMDFHHVYIINESKQLVNVHIYTEELERLNTNHFYCSTLQKAISILQLNISESKFIEMIESISLAEY